MNWTTFSSGRKLRVQTVESDILEDDAGLRGGKNGFSFSSRSISSDS